MAVKDKLISNECLKAVNDSMQGQVSDLKSAIDNDVVLKAGEHQVTAQNIDGVIFTKTSSQAPGDNVFSTDMLFREGQYAYISDGTIVVGENSDINSYVVPVDGVSTYVFPQCRFVALSTGNTYGSTAVGTTQANITQIDTTGASYMFMSFYTTQIDSIYVKPVVNTYVYSDFIAPQWMRNGDEKTKYVSGTGSFSASGDKIILANARTNLRKGSRLVFECAVTSGTDFDLGFSNAESSITSAHNVISITSSSITYDSHDYPHAEGYTIAGMVQFIFEYLDNGTASVTLLSNGNAHKETFSFAISSVAVPYVQSKGLVAANCKLTFTCVDLDNPIWIFGDSYVQYASTRWPYYLHEYGYDAKTLIDGFSGEGSTNARVAMGKLLNFGTPNFAVWCMGMNDGADTDASTPNADWVSGRGYFLSYCTANGITPIFATIPTVPTINNEGKNTWVRASGYRYIDFAKAVGANSSGEWYTGMLSNDDVHPSETGAKALFAQVLLDFPEIMLN